MALGQFLIRFIENLLTPSTDTSQILQPDGVGSVKFALNAIGIFFQDSLVLDGTELANRFIFNGDTNVTVTLPLESAISSDYVILVENQSTNRNRTVTILIQGSDNLIGPSVLTVGDMIFIERTGVGEFTSQMIRTALSEPAIRQIPNTVEAFIFSGNDWEKQQKFTNSAHWIYDTNIIVADPGIGKLRLNNTDLSLATKIAVSVTTAQGDNILNLFLIIQLTSVFFLRQFGDFPKEITFEITGVTNQGTFFELDIIRRTSTTFDGNGVELMLEIIRIPDQNKETITNKGIAGGYASLDGAGKIPALQLPTELMHFQGNWNAATNTPPLNNTDNDVEGFVYRASVAGSIDFGSGIISFKAGDWVFNNSTIWDKGDNTDAVASVFGRLGVVTAVSGDYNADQIDETANNKILTVTERGRIAAAIHVDEAGEFAAITEKLLPIGEDETIIEDSEDLKKKKRVKLKNYPQTQPPQEDDTISGTIDDYALANIVTTGIIRFMISGGNVTFTGLVPPSPDFPKMLIFLNADNSKTLNIQHEDNRSEANNRIICPDNVQHVLKKNSGVIFQRDTTSSRWRVVATKI